MCCYKETFEKRPLLPNPRLPDGGQVCVRLKFQSASGGSILEILNVWMPVPMKIGMVKIFAFPRSKSGIFDLTLNPAVSGKHFETASLLLHFIFSKVLWVEALQNFLPLLSFL